MGEAFLGATISNARPPERGCIATVLLAADGDLIASEPGGVAFPARALTAAQRAARGPEPNSPAGSNEPPKAQRSPGAPPTATIKVVPPAAPARPHQAQPGGDVAEAAGPTTLERSAPLESSPIVPVEPHGQA